MNFFFSITICKNFFTKISLCRNLSAQNDVTTRPDPLILLTVFDDWRYHLLCIAHGMWADYHLIDNELNQFPVWQIMRFHPHWGGPSNFSGGTWAIYSEFESLIFSVTICKNFFHQNKSLQEFFLPFNVILLYQEKKPLCAEWSKSILKEIIMFQKCV